MVGGNRTNWLLTTSGKNADSPLITKGISRTSPMPIQTTPSAIRSILRRGMERVVLGNPYTLTPFATDGL